MVFQVRITSSSANGDGDDEDNDIDQQEPLPRLTIYKEASYNYFWKMCAIFKFWLYIKGHGHEALSVSSIVNIDKIVNLKHASERQATLRDYFIHDQ